MGRTEAASAAVPWWAVAGVALALLKHHESLLQQRHEAAPRSDSRSGGQFGGSHPRQLNAFATDLTASPVAPFSPQAVSGPVGQTEPVFVPVPCFLRLIDPCGNVTVPEAGVDVLTPFGNYHVPGTETMRKELRHLNRSFSEYTVVFCVILFVMWVLITLGSTGSRRRMLRGLQDIATGRLADDEDYIADPHPLSPEEKEELAKTRYDPKSEDFIAPGNIYRLLALLPPSTIGLALWVEYAFKAMICLYMQLYLPIMLAGNVLQAWEYWGVKSPLWLLSNFWNFLAAFVALGTLCFLFAGKCSEQIRRGAEANFYILTHTESDGAVRTVRDGGSALAQPREPSTTASCSEQFWCWTSLGVNIITAFLLQVTMFLNVATFTDQVDHIVVVAVSLYFVLDLDTKIMDSDPGLRAKYRHAVGALTEDRPSRPECMMRTAALAIATVRAAVPVGLLGILLVAWRNRSTGQVIGGNPFGDFL